MVLLLVCGFALVCCCSVRCLGSSRLFYGSSCFVFRSSLVCLVFFSTGIFKAFRSIIPAKWHSSILILSRRLKQIPVVCKLFLGLSC